MSRRRRTDFEVESFEFMRASDSAALLRLAGSWQKGMPEGDIELVARANGGKITVLEELPGTGGSEDDGRWRAAYSVSPQLLVANTRFLIRTAEGDVRLPAPRDRAKAAEPEPAAAAPPPEEPEERPAREPRTSALGDLLPLRRSERDRRAVAGARARADRATSALRDELDRAARERVQLITDLRASEDERAELERELAEVRSAAVETHRSERNLRERQRLAAALDRELTSARQAERQARVEAAALQDEVDRLTTQLAIVREGVERSDEQLAAVESEAAALHERIAALGAAPAGAEADGASAVRGTIDAALAAIDERLQGLDEVEREASVLRAALATRLAAAREDAAVNGSV